MGESLGLPCRVPKGGYRLKYASTKLSLKIGDSGGTSLGRGRSVLVPSRAIRLGWSGLTLRHGFSFFHIFYLFYFIVLFYAVIFCRNFGNCGLSDYQITVYNVEIVFWVFVFMEYYYMKEFRSYKYSTFKVQRNVRQVRYQCKFYVIDRSHT